MSKQKFDCIIIGAGPAGLLAARHLKYRGRKFMIIERGRHLPGRTKNNEKDVVCGVGGAGLFSDGKVSYFPSATSLWLLNSESRLRKSFAIFEELLRRFGVPSLKWDPAWRNCFTPNQYQSEHFQKRYRSDYIDFNTRSKLIENLYEEVGAENFTLQCNVVKIQKEPNGYLLLTDNVNSSELQTHTVIYCGGRVGSLDFSRLLEFHQSTFIKYEVGVRIECLSSLFDLYKNDQTDCKIIKHVNGEVGLQVRTFCCCRDGEVIRSNVHDIISFNGSAEDEKTGKSNIGINVRVTDENVYPNITEEIKRIINGHVEPFECTVSDLLEAYNERVFLGSATDKIIVSFMKEILPIACSSDATIYGPVIDGFGYYPRVDNNLQYVDEKIWLAGDSVGRFRGLTAAMISGGYVAQCVDEYLAQRESVVLDELHIKASSIENIEVVYTAQSKKFFYCRDAVCEFVLNRGYLPLNPFRVFGYFLNDRVKRDVIRQCNNQLIRIANEFWVFGPISDGVLFEIALAKSLNLPICYFNISPLTVEIHPVKQSEIVFEPEVHAKQVSRESLLRFITGDIESKNDNQLSLFTEN